MNPNEEQKSAAESVGFRIDGLHVQDGKLNAVVSVDNFKEGDILIITTPDRVASLLASREQQVAENAARVIEGIPKTFLDHKEDGRREYNLDEQRAYNRAVFDISKAIHSASSPFLNRKGK